MMRVIAYSFVRTVCISSMSEESFLSMLFCWNIEVARQLCPRDFSSSVCIKSPECPPVSCISRARPLQQRLLCHRMIESYTIAQYLSIAPSTAWTTRSRRRTLPKQLTTMSSSKGSDFGNVPKIDSHTCWRQIQLQNTLRMLQRVNCISFGFW